MHKSVVVAVVILTLLISVPQSFAQNISDGAGTVGAAFLKFEPGSRPMGMGGAFTGLANDINTIFWNPAGLTSVHTRELTAMQHFWIADISSQSIGYAQRTNKIVWGASLVGSFPEIDRRIGPSLEPDSTVTVSGFATGLSLAYPLRKNASIGGTAKLISEQLDIQNVFGIAADIGVILRLIDNHLGVGITLQNAGVFFEEADRDEKLPDEYPPMALRAGFAYRIWKKVELEVEEAMPPREVWAFVADANLPLIDAYPSFHIGIERWFYDVVAARVGYRISQTENPSNGLSLGFGVKKRGLDSLANIDFQFDYAFVPDNDLGDSHRISFITRF
ncbi:MAG: PorV/PorQ family protein [Candidatus Poribacteria bacterium]|nr:PorV/PorQ family protein [Candidatus Poribacteria bacterium]